MKTTQPSDRLFVKIAVFGVFLTFSYSPTLLLAATPRMHNASLAKLQGGRLKELKNKLTTHSELLNKNTKALRGHHHFTVRLPKPAITEHEADQKLQRILKTYQRDVSRADALVSSKKADRPTESKKMSAAERWVRHLVNQSMSETRKQAGLDRFASVKGMEQQLKQGGFLKEEDPLGSFKLP